MESFIFQSLGIVLLIVSLCCVTTGLVRVASTKHSGSYGDDVQREAAYASGIMVVLLGLLIAFFAAIFLLTAWFPED